jgi:hypothetical protein
MTVACSPYHKAMIRAGKLTPGNLQKIAPGATVFFGKNPEASSPSLENQYLQYAEKLMESKGFIVDLDPSEADLVVLLLFGTKKKFDKFVHYFIAAILDGEDYQRGKMTTVWKGEAQLRDRLTKNVKDPFTLLDRLFTAAFANLGKNEDWTAWHSVPEYH